jgi:hypothetical protein
MASSKVIGTVPGYKFIKNRRAAVLAFPFNGGQVYKFLSYRDAYHGFHR